MDPVNRAGATLKTDDTDQVPWSRYRADALALILIAATRNADRQFGAACWPASVQSWVTAMMLTYDPAGIGCLQAESKAGSYAAAQAAATASQDCMAMANTADPDKIRSLLGLPPLTG